MYNLRLKYLICLLVYYVSLSSNLNASDIFDKDLEFIHQTLLEDHPGLYNPLDPFFLKKLEDSYNTAKEELRLVSHEDEKIKVLKNFGRSFQDSHLWIKYDDSSTQLLEIPAHRYEIQDLSEDVCWVYIPSFYPSSEKQKEDFRKIIEKLPTLREKTIVFDVRGNRGGSFCYGTKLVESLFGKTYADQRLFELYHGCYVNWRVSVGNLKHLKESILPNARRNHADYPSIIQWDESLVQNLEEAFLQNKPSYLKPLNFKGAFSFPMADNPAKNPIFVIVDRNCYSATLMFIDELKGMAANVILVGEVTGADSMYMELRTIPLPSGKGKLGFPMYVYIGPYRGNSIPYCPDIQYNGDLKNTIELQNFILNYRDYLSVENGGAIHLCRSLKRKVIRPSRPDSNG